MSKPSLDVIIPVYNGAKFVSAAIESIRAQTAPYNVEIYCVDDCSTDSSRELLRRLQSEISQLHLLEHDQQLGVAAARNTGISAGTSPLIAFLDQDDLWVPSKLEIQVPLFIDNPLLDYSVGLQMLELEPGMLRPTWCRPEWFVEPILIFQPSVLMVRRETINTIGMFNPEYVYGGDDVEWFARARSESLTLATVDQVLVTRRIHEHNTSGTSHNGNKDLLKLVRHRVTKAPRT